MRCLQLLFLSSVLLAGADDIDGLVGRWRSTDVSNAGVSSIFVFGKDKVIDYYSAVILDGTYKLVGTDTIILQTKDGPQLKRELEWDSDNRARIDDEVAGKSIELSRAAKRDAAHPLLGEWDATRDWNGRNYPARVLFFADGRNIWIVNLRVDTGRYALKEQSIRFEIQGRPAIEGNFVVTKDRLTLPNPRGGPSQFDRMDFDYLADPHRR